MVDLSKRFFELAKGYEGNGANNNGNRRAGAIAGASGIMAPGFYGDGDSNLLGSETTPVRKGKFQNMMNVFNLSIKELKEQIDLFISEAGIQNLYHHTANTSEAGAIVSIGSDQLKKKLQFLEEILQKMKAQVNDFDDDDEYIDKLGRSYRPSAQLKKHRTYIIQDLEGRLKKMAASVMETLEKRAKTLSSREARQKSLFGESRMHLYNTAPLAVARESPGTRNNPIHQNPAQNSFAKSNNNSNYNNSNPIPIGGHHHDDGIRKRTGAGISNHGNDSQSINQGNTNQFRYYGKQQHGQGNNQGYLVPAEATSFSSLYSQKQDTVQHVNRISEVQQVQKAVSELGQMFMKMATLVQEQGETVDAISANIDDTETNLQEAQGELMILLKRASEDRGLIMKLLLVTLILGMIMIYFWT